ncbi:MAG TPA: DUF484 family protein [Acidiferrobacter sp.]|nr:DUF484 family protein [Acidiferrobacter sp.]
MKRLNEDASLEEAVSRYLRDNPGYFERHEDVLEIMQIPHLGRGAATSLLQRQIALLRARANAKDSEWRGVLAVARDNDALAQKLHRLAVMLIDAASLDDVFGCVYDLARHELQLDVVVVALGVDGGLLGGRAEFVTPDDPSLGRVLELAGDRPLCGPKSVLREARSLLGAREADVSSVAVVPLRDAVRSGVLLLGSHDAQRFPTGAGTVYLSRLGELVMRAIARHLNR